MYAHKLNRGDEIRIIAPAKSFKSSFTHAMRSLAVKRLEDLGLRVSFGKYVDESNDFETTTVEHRLEDLHDAFADKNVKGILAVAGGASSNQLLKYIDYDLIRSNPKIFCGLSDITSIANAIHAKTDLVTYSGPQFVVFGATCGVDYTTEYFRKCFFDEESFDVEAAESFCDHRFDAEEMRNEGFWIMNEGEARGKVLGGNLLTFKYLQGTEFAPDMRDSILFLEDNDKESYRAFENQLQSLINQSGFLGVRGIVIGRFQKGSNMTKELLTQIIRTKRELADMPIIANVDFGHTMPMITIPLGGEVEMKVGAESVLRIVKH